MDADKPLDGRRIAIPESRQLDLFADMLEIRGASTLRCPLISIHDAPDQGPIIDWLDRFNAGACDDLILLTGEGLRRLLSAAERAGGERHAKFVEQLAQVRKITRGPKPARALREIGLRSDLPAAEPTTDGVMQSLDALALDDRRIGVQLYGSDPNDKLMDYLARCGAHALPVAPYVYANESEDAQVAKLIQALVDNELDAIAFTSSPQVKRLFTVARRHDLEAELLAGLNRSVVAAVGPLVADALLQRGVQVQLMPDSGYFMKPLVRKLVERFKPG